MQRDELDAYLNQYLESPRFRDYCPNGLQVEGRAAISRLVTGVTASLDLLQAAVAARADAVLVHHGYFWRGDDPRITGMRRRRIALLLQHDISLFGVHLPLDAHPEVGNNATLGRVLGLVMEGRFGDQEVGAIGRTAAPCTVGTLAATVERELGRAPLVIGETERSVGRIAWCTGAAQGYIEAAAAAGADVYLSGEISEQTVHFARENGVTFIAAGHHATERYGVQALGEHLAARFGITHQYIDIPNPV